MKTCLDKLKEGDIIQCITEAEHGSYLNEIVFACYLSTDKRYVIDLRHGCCYYLPHMDIIKIIKKK